MTEYRHEPNPAKRAALIALFAQIKARLDAQEKAMNSKSNA